MKLLDIERVKIHETMSILSWDRLTNKKHSALYCGTVQDELSQPVSIEPNEDVLNRPLDENNEPTHRLPTKVETSISEEDTTVAHKKTVGIAQLHAGIRNKFKRFTFFGEHLVQLTNHYSRKSVNMLHLRYALIIGNSTSAFNSLNSFTRLVITNYSPISILPSLTSTPNHIWMFIRFILFLRGVSTLGS